MLESILFWIWLAGFIILSPFVFFGWVLGCQLTGDSMDKAWRIKQCTLLTVGSFFFIWLWPLGIVVLYLSGVYKKRKQAKWDKKWAEKKAVVPNYWKNYYLIINGNVSDIQVRVLDWEFSEYIPGKARLAMWRGEQRFWAEGKEIIVYWPNKDLEPIPEKEEKV